MRSLLLGGAIAALVLTAGTALAAGAGAGARTAPMLGAGAPPATGSATSFSTHPRIYVTQAVLNSLRQRAAAHDPAWTLLKDECDTYLTGTVEWPDGNDYPDTNSIGEEYQGDGYLAAVANVGLCYQIVRTTSATLAGKYAAKGRDILTKMSALYGAGQHGENPLRDDGYGVRNYASGMAIGFDWLYPALSSSLKARVDAGATEWLTAYKNGGFEHTFPMGNYFAGYYAASALAGLAMAGSTTHGTGFWNDWLTRIHGKMVQPYYAANLSGGGWPEGWNYGPFAVVNMTLPALAAKTGAGLDLVGSAKPYAFPLSAPRYALYFAWPDLKTMEDSGYVYEGDEPAPAQPWFFGVEAGFLDQWGDSFAPVFHSFAADVVNGQPDEASDHIRLWQNFLFWNPKAPTKSYKTLPLSYLAKGMDQGAVRSSWDKTAVWGAFMGGPNSDYPDSGYELPDKGSLAIVRGSRNFLVNAWAALLRNTPGTEDGQPYYQQVNDNLFNGPADIFNVFFAGTASPWGQGDHLRADGNRTAMARFEDGKSYVAMRSTHLEDNYPRNDSEPKVVDSWTRDVVYLRPELFVVYDRTTVPTATTPQWMNFHLAQPTTAGTAPAAGVRRWDVGAGAKYAGTVETVLPAGHKDSLTGLFGKNKVVRLKVKPATSGTENRWLTVFDPAATKSEAARALPLTGARVKSGAVLGVCLRTVTKNYAVLAGSGAAGTAVAGEVKYLVPKAQTLHVVTDLQPNTTYTVTGSAGATDVTVDLKPGAGIKTSKTGVLSFQTSATGAVSHAPR